MRRQAESVEITAARAAGVVAVEAAVWARTKPLVVATGGGALVAIALAVLIGGALALLFGVVAVGLLLTCLSTVLLRRLLLRTVRRFVGGAQLATAEPIVRRYWSELRDADHLPIRRLSAVGLLRLALRPRELETQVRSAGEAIMRAVPQLLAELRQQLPT